MRRRLTGLCAAGTLAVAQLAFAQEVADEVGVPPRYFVEVIIFAYNEADLTEELFDHRRAEHAAPQTRRQPLIVGSAEAADTGFRSQRRSLDESVIVLDSLTLEELVFAPPLDEASSTAGDEVFDDTAVLAPALPAGQSPSADGLSPTSLPGALGADEPPVDELDRSVRVFEDGRLREFRFRLLKPEELTLQAAYAQLERLSAYEPLAHGGWVQDGLPEGEAAPFNLAYLGVSNPAGTIKLHLSRFLHLTLNLDYRRAGQESFAVRGPNPFALGEVELQPRYTISTQRRARSGELHYIDHPLFGVLLRVTPEPESEERDSELGSTPAA